MKYPIYQLHLTDEQYNLVNRVGWAEAEERNPAVTAYRATKFRGSDKWETAHFPHYNKVAVCEADNLEHVFAIMNHWQEEERVERLAKLHSLSVGDIIENPVDNRYYMVDGVGFTKIEVC